jgi:DNA-binding transcriptional ArsR family regulator
MPYPSISKTSQQMGVTRKTLGKKFASLEDKGLIRLIEKGGKRYYALNGLTDALTRLEDPVAEPDEPEEKDFL